MTFYPQLVNTASLTKTRDVIRHILKIKNAAWIKVMIYPICSYNKQARYS